jgi:hypothetical protein
MAHFSYHHHHHHLFVTLLLLLGVRADAPPPPTLVEVLPTVGRAGTQTRLCILGSNFIDSPDLAVRFGDAHTVTASFHGVGTILCNTPALPAGNYTVTVANDGTTFCEATDSCVLTVR